MIRSELNEVIEALDLVKSSHQFRSWVRVCLRRHIPHAAFLATYGRLYGPGSVPTHRLDVDFPLHLLEELKTSTGALNDPSLFSWFRNQRVRHIDLVAGRVGTSSQWRDMMTVFGFRNVLVHGMLDHETRRFAVFQMFNVFDGGSSDLALIFRSLVGPMTRAGWDYIECRSGCNLSRAVGHPTVLLTPAEIQIIGLLAQGLSNKEIARRRGVSDSTVKTQVQRTGAKLGATRRAEIVALAMQLLAPLPAQGVMDYDDHF